MKKINLTFVFLQIWYIFAKQKERKMNFQSTNAYWWWHLQLKKS